MADKEAVVAAATETVAAVAAETARVAEVGIQEAPRALNAAEQATRYLGYGGRLRTIGLAASRYLAFTSDVGEAFRPVIPPRVVTATYGISWLYCLGDVAVAGYKDLLLGSAKAAVARTVAERTVFQSVASMALPALTIHTTVRVFSHAFKKVGRFQKWGPTIAGLAVVPFLPVFDHPVEHSVGMLFDTVWPTDKSKYADDKTEKKD